MKFWTVQKKSVLDEIEKNGVYEPDFAKSDAALANSDIADMYDYLLFAYNRLNHSQEKGLIFGFQTMNEDGALIDFADIFDFQDHIVNEYGKVWEMWEKYNKEEYVVLELDFQGKPFHPVFIHYNDWLFMTPPIEVNPPFEENYFRTLFANIPRGAYMLIECPEPGTLAQVHAPRIEKADIVKVYDYFSLE